MASNGYPKLTAKAWTALRARAAAAPTTRFTATTVAALMDMASPKSAADNTVYPMRRLGLIDEDGALTARGNKWRTDGTFADACQEILEEVYPDELAALTDEEGRPDPQKVRSWFDHKGFGESNARQMSATYVMVAGKQIPDAATTEPTKAPAKARRPSKKGRAAGGDPQASGNGGAKRGAGDPAEPQVTLGPNLHLDVQIHIPADASAEQIDQIFASMARHLYPR